MILCQNNPLGLLDPNTAVNDTEGDKETVLSEFQLIVVLSGDGQ